jgi:hypothetical protein
MTLNTVPRQAAAHKSQSHFDMIAICVLLLRDNLDENRGSKRPRRRAAKSRDEVPPSHYVPPPSRCTASQSRPGANFPRAAGLGPSLHLRRSSASEHLLANADLISLAAA